MPVDEATIEETPYGRYVTSAGWFVLNLTEALAVQTPSKSETVFPIEPRDAPFRDFGINVRVLAPGKPNALYHSEQAQEGFLVLDGECTLLVEEEERTLRKWDYFHCPAGTLHVAVGAGDGPCTILMVGARRENEELFYPASELAAKHGAAAAKDTHDPDEAYAGWGEDAVPTRVPWPL